MLSMERTDGYTCSINIKFVAINTFERKRSLSGDFLCFKVLTRKRYQLL